MANAPPFLLPAPWMAEQPATEETVFLHTTLNEKEKQEGVEGDGEHSSDMLVLGRQHQPPGIIKRI